MYIGMATAEIYQPTSEDIARIKSKPDKLKISGDGVFATLQGEGVTSGEPSVFIRLQFCNLQCGKNGGWICDTGYTWDTDRKDFWKEPVDWGFAETAKNIEDAWQQKFGDLDKKRVVITGGEPMMQQKKIIELLKHLPDWAVEIETNGTIVPDQELANCQFNCSPKLENSGNSKIRRYKPEALKKINELPNSWFKFVVVTPEDFEEIDSIVLDCGLKPEKILIMPEGQTEDAVELHLEGIMEMVKDRGWKITYRNQLIWFGPKRKT